MRNISWQKILLYIIVILAGLLFIIPLLFTLLSSLKNNVEIFRNPFNLPTEFKFSNYVMAWKDANMGRYLLNSLFISGSVVIITMVIASMASYAIARFNLKVNRFLLLLFVLGMMFPLHTVLIPISYVVGSFDLRNNLFFLILLYVAFCLPFSILVLTRFMRGINRSLEEAAIIDGASYFQVFRRVIFPMSLPGLSTISIFNFLLSWNDILFPLVIVNDNKLKPVALGLLNFSGERTSEFGPLMAAIGITILVPLIVYILFQERIEDGLAAGAVKE